MSTFEVATRHLRSRYRPRRAYHTAFLDGVFAPDEDGKLEFHPFGSLSNGQFADLIQAVRMTRAA
jgi:hypothetical protein